MKYRIYDATADEAQRFALGSVGERPLLVVGVNPHAATQDASDRTATLVEAVAMNHGYDSFILVNLYPVRSKTVAELPKEPNTRAIARNRAVIEQLLNKLVERTLWLAWGNDVKRRAYLQAEAENLLLVAHKLNAHVLHFGPITKQGQPRHPPRLSHAWTFHAWSGAHWASAHGA